MFKMQKKRFLPNNCCRRMHIDWMLQMVCKNSKGSDNERKGIGIIQEK